MKNELNENKKCKLLISNISNRRFTKSNKRFNKQ